MPEIGSSRSGCPFFLTFEGPEGSGKTTQVKLFAEHIRALGREVVCTREPGGTVFGDAIRGLLLNHSTVKPEAQTEMYLMLAQRTENLFKVVVPALERGAVVLCDRFMDSSLAYQGYARGLDPDYIFELHQHLLGKWMPGTTVLFDISPEQGLERASHGGRKQPDRMEKEDLAFHGKVRQGYLTLAKKHPERFVVIDASKSQDDVFKQLTTLIKKRIPELSPQNGNVPPNRPDGDVLGGLA